jgi:hypothetical protein
LTTRRVAGVALLASPFSRWLRACCVVVVASRAASRRVASRRVTTACARWQVLVLNTPADKLTALCAALQEFVMLRRGGARPAAAPSAVAVPRGQAPSYDVCLEQVSRLVKAHSLVDSNVIIGRHSARKRENAAKKYGEGIMRADDILLLYDNTVSGVLAAAWALGASLRATLIVWLCVHRHGARWVQHHANALWLQHHGRWHWLLFVGGCGVRGGSEARPVGGCAAAAALRVCNSCGQG